MSTPGVGTRRFADVKVGDELAPLSIDVSTRLIVAGAIATRDFQDVHHDKDGAQALGSPHIFMNILTTNGLVGRYVTDWAGPEAMLRSVKIRLGAPNYPGDVMVFSGKVVSVDAGEQVAEIEVAGKNRLGSHVTGSVTVALP
ncbi:MAG TPA: MaoC family dehydratase [Pseudomonadales bacterium]|nr:MaoC family dehydratase [Pseudomonadales bacterium]HNC69847.1 MaoC family dehydratase [Pseudomonadales bacterium]HND14325.1 MaoC family dehydratase [Pseudomonadales bacterium]